MMTDNKSLINYHKGCTEITTLCLMGQKRPKKWRSKKLSKTGYRSYKHSKKPAH